jgi:outer membrane protein assembly factor BamB/ABC-type transport system substrate-binding protein
MPARVLLSLKCKEEKEKGEKMSKNKGKIVSLTRLLLILMLFSITMLSSHMIVKSYETLGVNVSQSASGHSGNLLINGGFENGLADWSYGYGGVGDHSHTVVADGTYPDVMFYQRWNSGNDGGSIHVGQNLEIFVSSYRELYMELDVKVISNSLPDSGWWSDLYGGNGEFPARVLVNYEDANGGQWQWDHHFFPSDNYERYGRTNFEYVPRNTWCHYVSPNLVDVTTTTTGPGNTPLPSSTPYKITSVWVGGTGWDFSGMFDNVRLSGTRTREWPMFHQDPVHTGYSDSVAPNTNNTIWSYTVGDLIWTSSPTVADGKVYFGSWDNKTYCLNANTGEQIWNYTTGGFVSSSPAVVEDRVYLGSYDDNVYCLNATTGEYIWNYATGDIVVSSPIIADGEVYVGSMDNKTYCLDANTGEQIWNYTTGNWVASSPAVGDGKVYVGSGDHKIYCLDAATGSQVWNFTTGDWVESSPAVVEGLVFIGSADHNVYALDANTGEQIWNYTTGDWVISSPAVGDGKVYVGSEDTRLYCLNSTTGEQVWNYTTGLMVRSSPAVGDGKVYVGSFDKNVYCLNASAGALIWSYLTEGRVVTSPAIADGKVYVGSGQRTREESKVYAFEDPVYTLTITTGGGGTTDPAPGTLEYYQGTTIAVTAAPSMGCYFDHWDFDGSWIYSNPIVVTMNSNHSLHATFNYSVTIEAHCYTENADVNLNITLDGSPTDYTTPHTFNVSEPHNFTVPDADLNEHFFKQWDTSETNTTIEISSPGIYRAYYQARYNLTITATLGGTTDPASDSYTYWEGTEAIVNATPILGYVLDYWELDTTNVGNPNPIIVTMNAHHTLNAVFSWVGICNITIGTTAGGTTSPVPGTYAYTNGTYVEVTAIPDSGYGFDHWDFDGSWNYSNPVTVTMDSNHTLVAFFRLVHTLTITKTLGGTTDPLPGPHVYLEGTAVTVTANPYASSNFDHWELDGSWNYSNPVIVTMGSDHALHAVFKFNITIQALCETEGAYISVNITMDGSPTGYVTPHTFTNLSEAHSFTVPSTDDAGHAFWQWEGGQKSTTITVEGGTYTVHYGHVVVVGGEKLPIDKVRLLIPYAGMTSAIVAVAAATAIYIRRRKPKSTCIAKSFSVRQDSSSKRHAPGKKTISTLVISALLATLLVFSIMSTTAFSMQPPVDTTTYYIGTIGQPSRLDPARAYDTASGELLQNIYQTLIWWNDKHPITFTPGVGYNLQLADYADLDSYEPVLCTEVPTRGNGRITDTAEGGTLWRFTINTAATFQPWTDHLGVVQPARAITAGDVVYSFRRQVVYDSIYSPVWMWMTPAFGCASWRSVYGGPYDTYTNYTFVNTADELACGVQIENWCYAVGNDVYFNFTLPWAEGPLRQIFAQTWGGVVNPDWVKEMGGWDGLFVAGWTNNYHGKPTNTRSELDTYKDPAVFPGHGSQYASFTQVGARGAVGTGPYKFTSWDTTTKVWRIDYYPAYWKGWADAGDKAGNYFHTVIEKGVDSWPTRKMLFLEGEFDVCAVPRANMYELLTSTYNPIAGINLAYNIAALQNDVMLFGFSVPPESPYQSFVGYPTHKTLGEPFFFNNTHMRRAFAWALDYATYISDAWFGEAIYEDTWWVEGLSPAEYKNTALTHRTLDLTQMQNELNQAVIAGYNVGAEGFEMTLAYNIGNNQRVIACNLIAQAFLSLGSKYKCNVIGLDWPVFLDAENKGYLPMYASGWLADFADPDNFCEPYQASWGAFCSGQFDPANNAQPEDQAFVDNEISAAMIEPDYLTRKNMYWDLQERYWNDVPSFPLAQPAGRRFARDWVQGWYYNALYPGLYAYDLYKSTASTVNVDVDMTATVTPATPTYPIVYIWHNQMRIGNGNANPAIMTYSLHVKRNADASGITTLYTAVGLRRNGTPAAAPGGVDDQFANATFVALLSGGDATATLKWWEDGVTQIMYGTATGVLYNVSGAAQVIAPTNALDNVKVNNVQQAGSLKAYSAIVGDITGNGFVDIFDAIRLANAFGTRRGEKFYNADADLNSDGTIDIFDAILLSNNFNKHVP